VEKKQPILITEVPRSGAGIIAGALQQAGIFFGEVNALYQNTCISDELVLSLLQQNADPNGYFPLPAIGNQKISVHLKDNVTKMLSLQGRERGQKWAFVDHRLILDWKAWNAAFPEALWVVVRRDTEDIINSCLKTGWMQTYHKAAIQQRLGVSTAEAGWRWMVEQYLIRLQDLYNGVRYNLTIHPHKVARKNYGEIEQLLSICGCQMDENVLNYVHSKLRRCRNEN